MLGCDVSGTLFIDSDQAWTHFFFSHLFSVPQASLTHRAVAPGLTLPGDHPLRAELAVLKAIISISLPFAQCLEAKPTLAQLFIPTPARHISAGQLPSVVIGTRHLLPKWILKPMSRRIIKLTQP